MTRWAVVFVLGCGSASAPRPAAPATRSVAIGASGLCIDIAAGLTDRVVGEEDGYIDVLVGDMDAGHCTTGIEVYTAEAPDRPRGLAALAESLRADHEEGYQLITGPDMVERDGRSLATTTLQNAANGVQQRQLAFMVGDDPVVVSSYTTSQLAQCDALERAVLASLRRCTAAR